MKNGLLALEDVLQRDDQAVARIRVQRLLEAFPGVGPVKAQQHLHELGISPAAVSKASAHGRKPHS
ncbi:hypothetical protein ACIOWI_36150 [Streptomyces sp. NPDC087659]|uniref:hypothetical protein n=1 Tax=Streptomyces sp. NPDC087659 TaxID=3365801 RepID=UPI00382E1F6E